jgi:hypothetical protein
MIVDGVSGFLVREEREFVDAVKRLSENPDLVDEISHHARERCAAMFNLERLHESVLKIYALMRPREPAVGRACNGLSLARNSRSPSTLWEIEAPHLYAFGTG